MNSNPTLTSSSLPPPPVNLDPPVRLPRLLLGLALAVAVFDLCFWNIAAWGISVSLFFAALAGIILGNRESKLGRSTGIILVLLAGAIVEAAIETGVTNTFVLLILTVVLAGETYFSDIPSIWGRWLSQIWALFFAPGRVFWLAARLMEAGFSRKGMGVTGGLIGGCLLAIPALLLALVFGSLLAAGNAVFGSWTNSFFDWFWKELALYLDPWRIALWAFAAFVILPLLRPVRVADYLWKGLESIPRFPELLPTSGALFSSGLVLVVLNLLFLVSNTADALFLWSGQALPAGVTDKEYVHEGVETLIFTVILSAFVLATIFQQTLAVAKRPGLKVLAYAWIAQNLFLMVGVAEKLRRYIVTEEMTVARLSTIIFLILVGVGFVLLTIKIRQDRSISWLIGGCAIAVFFTFYTTQFLDLAGWSANYNVAVMEKDRAHVFDSNTMCEWGADVWPALRRAHQLAPENTVITQDWNNALTGLDYTNKSGRDWQHWREFGLRAYWNRWALEEKKK